MFLNKVEYLGFELGPVVILLFSDGDVILAVKYLDYTLDAEHFTG